MKENVHHWEPWRGGRGGGSQYEGVGKNLLRIWAFVR